MSTDKTKISELPLAGVLTGNETAPILQGGITKRTLFSTIRTWLKTYFDTIYDPIDTITNVDGTTITGTGLVDSPLTSGAIAGTGVTYGYINDAQQAIVGNKQFDNITAGIDRWMGKVNAYGTQSLSMMTLKANDPTVGNVAGISFGITSALNYFKAAIGFERTTTEGRGDIVIYISNTANQNNALASEALFRFTREGKFILVTAPTAESTTANPPLTRDTSTGEIKTGGKQVVSVASDTTPNPTGWAYENEYYLTALAGAAEFAAPSGTPVNGNTLLIRIKDDGTARAITWNAIYKGFSQTLPSTTILGKEMYLGFIYNSASSKWDLISRVDEV